MAYIGQNADGNFTTSVSKDTFSGNGSTTAFTLSEGATTNTVDVFVENIRQEPTTAYTVDGTTLTFTAAPVSGTDNIYVVNRGPIQLSASHPAAQALTAHSATITTDLTVDTDTLYVDSTNNNVGIGTTSPASNQGFAKALEISDSGGTTGPDLMLTNPTAGTDEFLGQISFNHADECLAAIPVKTDGATDSASIQFQTQSTGGGLTERMRIDSSGNLLVGKTTTDIATAGSRFISNGQIQATASGQEPYFANRLSSNGVLFDFRKDGTTVGSIVAQGSARIAIGTGDTGLIFNQSNESIHAWNIDANTNRTDNIDLGNSSNRFKDLYLGGGAYIGGTGSANHLDDYEEGTWTPTVSTGSVSANMPRYVKVGRQVTLWTYLSGFTDRSSSNSIQVNGLPFTSSSSSRAIGATFHRYINANGDSVAAYITNSAGYMQFYSSKANSQYVLVLHSHLNASSTANIFLTITYEVD